MSEFDIIIIETTNNHALLVFFFLNDSIYHPKNIRIKNKNSMDQTISFPCPMNNKKGKKRLLFCFYIPFCKIVHQFNAKTILTS